ATVGIAAGATVGIAAGATVAFAAVTAATGLGLGWLPALSHTAGLTQWTSPPTGVGMAVGYLLRWAGRPDLAPVAVTVARAAGRVGEARPEDRVPVVPDDPAPGQDPVRDELGGQHDRVRGPEHPAGDQPGTQHQQVQHQRPEDAERGGDGVAHRRSTLRTAS